MKREWVVAGVLALAQVACIGGPAEVADAGVVDAGGSPDAGVSSCPEGLRSCDELCVDLAEDARHCGVCNQACASDEGCLGGACTAVIGPVTEYVLDDGGKGCDTGFPRRGVVVDDDLRIYLGLVCDDTLTVAVSEDRGRSFTFVPVGVTQVQGFRMVAGAAGEVHLGVIHGQPFEGVLSYARTVDGGRTWSAPRPVDLGPLYNAPYYFSEGLLVHEGDVYLTSHLVGAERTTRVFRGDGVGAFRLVSEIGGEREFGFETELFAHDGAVVLVEADDPNLDVRTEIILRSEDRGESFELAREVPRSGGRMRVLRGDRVYYADTNGVGLGYYSLTDEADVMHFARTEDGRASTALAFGRDGSLFTLVTTGDPILQPNPGRDLLLRLDPEGGVWTSADIAQGMGAPEVYDYTQTLSNTQLSETPGDLATIIAYARGGDVFFQVREP